MAKKNGNADDSTALATVDAPDYQQYVEQVDNSWLEGIKIERIVTLEAGQGVRGMYLGIGPTVEVTDPVTGEVRDLPTRRIEVKKDIVVRLLDTSQLKRELDATPVGTRLRIIKLGQVDTRKGRRVNDFIVAPETTQPAANGTQSGIA